MLLLHSVNVLGVTRDAIQKAAEHPAIQQSFLAAHSSTLIAAGIAVAVGAGAAGYLFGTKKPGQSTLDRAKEIREAFGSAA